MLKVLFSRLIFLMVLLMAVPAEDLCAQRPGSGGDLYGRRESFLKRIFGGSGSQVREPKVKEPRAVVKAKKKQEKQFKQQQKASDKAISDAKKRHVAIQSADVQERMKENRREARLREKERKRHEREMSRIARRKYKK